MEEAERLKCVTRGSLIIPREEFNAESDLIQFSLKAKDPAWDARLRKDEWNAKDRTFKMVSSIEKQSF